MASQRWNGRGSSSASSNNYIVEKSSGLNNFGSIKRWNEAARRGSFIICGCGFETECLTSMTDGNPGRRFRRCSKKKNDGGCGYWKWIDPPVCLLATQLIPLLRDDLIELRNSLNVKDSVMSGYEFQIRRYQEEIERLKAQNVKQNEKGKMNVFWVVSFVMILAIVYFKKF